MPISKNVPGVLYRYCVNWLNIEAIMLQLCLVSQARTEQVLREGKGYLLSSVFKDGWAHPLTDMVSHSSVNNYYFEKTVGTKFE